MISQLLSYKIPSWNVRGLNNPTRQEEVKQMINLARPDVVCIQGTKMEDISATTVINSLRHDYETNFFFHPAIGTRVGILLAAKSSTLSS
jgi:exonuclease III